MNPHQGREPCVRSSDPCTKVQVFAEYGIDYSLHSGYEVDHIISLELGGSNDISNLFPESYSIQYGARIKDKFENHLHKLVCDGTLPIATAQQEIATGWVKYYIAWQGNASATAPLLSAQGSVPASANLSSDAAYYTSSYSTAKYYYPASCNAWKSLSQSYIASFSSLSELLSKFPNRTLSPQCHFVARMDGVD